MTASLFSFYKGGVIELFYYLLRTWWLTDSCLTLNSKASNDDDDLRGASTMVYYYSVRNMDESSWVELSQAESSWVELPFSWKMCIWISRKQFHGTLEFSQRYKYKIYIIHIGDPVFFQLHIPLHSFDAMLLLEHNRQSIIIQLRFPVENFTKVWNTSGPQRLDT